MGSKRGHAEMLESESEKGDDGDDPKKPRDQLVPDIFAEGANPTPQQIGKLSKAVLVAILIAMMQRGISVDPQQPEVTSDTSPSIATLQFQIHSVARILEVQNTLMYRIQSQMGNVMAIVNGQHPQYPQNTDPGNVSAGVQHSWGSSPSPGGQHWWGQSSWAGNHPTGSSSSSSAWQQPPNPSWQHPEQGWPTTPPEAANPVPELPRCVWIGACLGKDTSRDKGKGKSKDKSKGPGYGKSSPRRRWDDQQGKGKGKDKDESP